MDIQKISQKINLNKVSENKKRAFQPKPLGNKQDENILVVRREYLFPEMCWQGLEKPKESMFGSNFLEIIMAKKEFMPRSLMEKDFNYKQIIPYLIFKHEDKYFLMQRKAKASETRLQSKYSLGIGGHIRQEDIKTADIAQWAEREFLEEVDYSGNFDVKFLGVLNDDSNDVGKVHVGFVYLLEGDSPNICVKSELESGILLTLEELVGFYDRMEPWSKIVFAGMSSVLRQAPYYAKASYGMQDKNR